VLAVSSAQAAHPGALDTSFGSGGKVKTSFGSTYDEIDGLALQPDGKLVAAGAVEDSSGGSDFGLTRYKPGGALDPSFGTGGKVTTSFGTGYEGANAALVLSDKKIVAAGYAKVGTKGEFALARYKANGSLDTSFGTAGKVTTDVGPAGSIYDAALQPDGKIVGVGYAEPSGSIVFELARYNPNGSLDSTFGTGGKVTTSFGAGFAYAESAALQPDGKILAGGFYYDGTLYHFALVRYNANGSLDASFGTGGKVITSIGPTHSIGREVALQPDGKIVMGGYSFNGTTYDLTLIRYNANGSVDSSFGNGGTVLTSFGTGWRSSVNKLLIQRNGKIVAAGYTRLTDRDFFALARYKPNGTLDTSFGSGGKIKTPFGTIDDYADAAVLQPDGKIVVGGTSVQTPDYLDSDFALARYQGDTCKVPKLKGRKLKAAKRLIVRHTCVVGKVKKRFSKRVKKGRVLKQRPAAGTKVASSTPVNLTVSKGRHRH
jgi:uncharacterized delta-60 repeat protein